MKIAAVLLLASAMTVFDSCGEMQSTNDTTVETVANCCYTDPPIGCSAVCFGQNVDMQFVGCNNAGAGENAQNFIFEVLLAQDKLHKVGAFPCEESNPIRVITPCDISYMPVLNPANQDLETCSAPALNCSVPTNCKWP